MEKLPWNNQLGMYHGAPIGQNVRIAKGIHIGSVLAIIEEKFLPANKPTILNIDFSRSALTLEFLVTKKKQCICKFF